VPPRPALVPLVFNGEDRARWCDLAGVAADVVARFGRQRFEERMLITHRGLSGPAILQISSYWDGRSAIPIELVNMPRRLAQRWTGETNEWNVVPAGTEGFAKAEVTAGGVHPDELSSQTMESRRVPGLYFIGEVVDVTGHLGGFNFQWAWASAHAAGVAL
jgi:predicted flavoprotein YhiN